MVKSYDIVLCTFNGSPFVAEQIESFFYQSVLPSFIIVSDDGSNDNTLEIVKDTFAKHRFHSFRILNNNGCKRGIMNNYFYALQYCQADYTFFADQDDIWDCEKVEQFIFHFSADVHMPKLIFSDSILIDECSHIISDSYFSYQGLDVAVFEDDSIFFKNCVQGAASCINRSMRDLVLYSIKNINTRNLLMHDHWLALLAKYYGKYIYIDKKLLFYRQHSKNEIGAFNKRYRFFYYLKNFSIFYKNLQLLLSQKEEFEKFCHHKCKKNFLHRSLGYRSVSKLKLFLLFLRKCQMSIWRRY